MDKGFQVMFDGFAFGFIVMFAAGIAFGMGTWIRRFFF